MKILNFVLPIFLLPSATFANEVLLYDAPPPEDAAFVRFVGFDSAAKTWKDAKFEAKGENKLSNYFIVHAPKFGLEIGDMLTIIPNDIIISEPEKNPGKVTLGLVNLTSDPIELKAKDGTINVITPVEVNQAGWREVNPVSVSVQVYSKDESLGESLTLSLRRGEHHTLVVKDNGEVIDVISSVNKGIVD